MNRVSGYSAYQSSYYDNAVRNRKEQNKSAKTEAAKKAGKTDKTGGVQLSAKAKALLQELQKTYGNMDFIVADYDSEEEAASYLSRGTKAYTTLIDPEELERMASDESVKEKNLSLLDEAVGKLDDLKGQLGDHKDEVLRMGVSIGKDGEFSYFAELEKAGERQRQFIESIRDHKREAAEKTETDRAGSKNPYAHGYERGKRTTVYASDAEELLDKIINVDWDSVREESTAPQPGGHFSSTI